MDNLKINTFTEYSSLEHFPLEQRKLMEIAYSYYDGKFQPLNGGNVLVKFDENKKGGHLYEETLFFDSFSQEFKVQKQETWDINENKKEIIKNYTVLMSNEEYQKWGKFGLKYEYELMCGKYINLFAKKYSLYENGWVDYVGGIYGFDGIYFFNFDEIRWDIDTNQPKNIIIDWFSDTLEQKEENRINYVSYTKGLRYE